MVQALRHRGPDGEGRLGFPGCLLGHTRLSIIDLATGAQPMQSSQSPCAVTFNGEIYGYRELRASFPERPFATTSDTEIILALYERHGLELARHLPGMFAFALWDEGRQRLVCARDRFGEKPFYYALRPDGTLLFASEIKALLASGLVGQDLDATALRHYLLHGVTPARRSILSQIQVLAPGHCLVYEDSKVRIGRYWDLPAPHQRMDLGEAAEEFRGLFQKAVARQLVADVPVGVFLSGGLDSTSIVAEAAPLHPGLATFSFGFGGDQSELPLARATAALYSTDHHELHEDMADLGVLVPAMAGVYDEPFADSSCIPTWLLCRQARQHTAVVLGGDGGDEMLGGYTARYAPILAMLRARERQGSGPGLLLLRLARRLAMAVGATVPPAWTAAVSGGLLARKQYTAVAAARSMAHVFSPAELSGLGLAPVDRDIFPSTGNGPGNGLADGLANGLDGVLRDDVGEYLCADILTKVDRAAMAHGLEVRCPFLDRDLAEFCIALPWSLKTDGSQGKLLLRRAMAQAWPQAVRERRAKQGFGAPVGRWLAQPDGRALKERFLFAPNLRLHSLLDKGACLAHSQRDDARAWSLLTLSVWLETRPASTETPS